MTDNEPGAGPVRAAVAAAELPTAMVPATADAPPPPSSSSPPPTGWPWRATTLVAALVALLMAGVVGYTALRSGTVDGRLVSDGEEVARQAAITAVTAVTSYDYQDVDGTVDTMNELATPALAAELAATLESLRSVIVEQRTVVTAEVTLDGLADFRSDCETEDGPTQCATVLLAVETSTTRGGVVDPQGGHYRLSVVMTLIDHQWLLSDIEYL